MEPSAFFFLIKKKSNLKCSIRAKAYTGFEAIFRNSISYSR